MGKLYPDGYVPPRLPKGLDCTSMVCSGKGQAGDVLRRYGIPETWGDPTEAVGWFDDDGNLVAIVVDYQNGRRAEHRIKSRSVVTRMWTPPKGPEQ